MDRLLKKFEAGRAFTENDAWLLFRIAAIAEAVGWSLLISGILLKQYVFHNNMPVSIAGQLHGTIFLLYIVAALGLYPSLRWSRHRAVIAALASVPPYGSLLFEQWASYNRRAAKIKVHKHLAAYNLILKAAT